MLRYNRPSGLFLILFTIAVLSSALASAAPFRLGVINEQPERPILALQQYGPLHAYLDAQLQARGLESAGLVVASSLEEMAARIRAGTVNALIEGVMPTLELQRQGGQLDIRLLLWRKGQRQYQTVFFTRNDSPITRLDELRGKTIVFESHRSTSAYGVPRAVLREAGLRVAPHEGLTPADAAEREMVQFVFAKTELNQAYWVHSGRGDAGAINNGDWERLPESIKRDLRIFHVTLPVLRWLLSFVTTTDARTRHAVEEILLSMHRDPEGRAALEAASGITKIELLSAEDRANLMRWNKSLARLDADTGQ